MDREAWHTAVHGVTKSWTWLSDWTETSVFLGGSTFLVCLFLSLRLQIFHIIIFNIYPFYTKYALILKLYDCCLLAHEVHSFMCLVTFDVFELFFHFVLCLLKVYWILIFFPHLFFFLCPVILLRGSQVALEVKNPLANGGDMRCGFDPRVGKILWRRAWQPTSVFLSGESHENGGNQVSR